MRGNSGRLDLFPDNIIVHCNIQYCHCLEQNYILYCSLLHTILYTDMEFGTKFTRTPVLEKSFTPKYCVNYNLLCKEKNLFYPFYLSTQVSQFLLLHWTKNTTKKGINRNKKRICTKYCMFKSIFFPRR